MFFKRKMTTRFFLLLLFILPALTGVYAYQEVGEASWYGPNFHGKRTANGEIFNTYDYTAAHKTLPFNSIVKVISLVNKKEVIVRINDRGPYAHGRIIDLSKRAAADLGLLKTGVMKVKIIVLKPGNNDYYRYNKQGKKSYTIQIASFSRNDYAKQMASKLRAHDIPVTIVIVKVKNKTYYRLQAAGLSYDKMQKVKSKLHSQGIHKYLVKEN